MFDHTYAVIMAGGGGTRLWPVSRRSRPKHLLPLFENKTLFQVTVERLEGFFLPDHILVVTVSDQAEKLQEQTPHIPKENFLLEPEPRGTASVIGLAAVVLQKRDPESIMVSLPSDHYIRNRDLFYLLLRVATEVAEKGYLVTLGITPTYPATGYGYIQRGDPLPEQFVYPVYRVLRFKEKPTEPQAREMITQGDLSWNSGIFIWQTKLIMKELERQMPDLRTALNQIGEAWGTQRYETVMHNVWLDLKTETIDYGVMENAEQTAVLPAGGLDWSDMGSWDSLFDILLPDKDGNIVFSSHHIPVDTYNSLVYGNRDKRLVVTIGVDDLIIVDNGDVLLVCRKDQAQKVRQVVSNLKNSDLERYA